MKRMNMSIKEKYEAAISIESSSVSSGESKSLGSEHKLDLAEEELKKSYAASKTPKLRTLTQFNFKKPRSRKENPTPISQASLNLQTNNFFQL